MAGNFSNRLKHYDMKVGELTGDSQMTNHQFSEASVIVTTPEKQTDGHQLHQLGPTDYR
jgi:pre-mRNA-splicing helicase BRR2